MSAVQEVFGNPDLFRLLLKMTAGAIRCEIAERIEGMQRLWRLLRDEYRGTGTGAYLEMLLKEASGVTSERYVNLVQGLRAEHGTAPLSAENRIQFSRLSALQCRQYHYCLESALRWVTRMHRFYKEHTPPTFFPDAERYLAMMYGEQ